MGSPEWLVRPVVVWSCGGVLWCVVIAVLVAGVIWRAVVVAVALQLRGRAAPPVRPTVPSLVKRWTAVPVGEPLAERDAWAVGRRLGARCAGVAS